MKCGHCLVVDSLNEHSCPAQANIVSIQRMAAVRRGPGVVCSCGTALGNALVLDVEQKVAF